MRTKEELQALFQLARDNGCPWIEVDGVKLPVPEVKAEPVGDPVSPEIPSDPSAEYTDEEILFYSTPYFDELQKIKEEKKKHAEEESEFRKSL